MTTALAKLNAEYEIHSIDSTSFQSTKKLAKYEILNYDLSSEDTEMIREHKVINMV